MWGLIIKGWVPGGSVPLPLEYSEVLERFRGELGEVFGAFPIHWKIGEMNETTCMKYIDIYIF